MLYLLFYLWSAAKFDIVQGNGSLGNETYLYLKKKLWKYINHSQNERNVRNEYEIYIIIISN